MKRAVEILAVLVAVNLSSMAQSTGAQVTPKTASINDLDMAYSRAVKAVTKALGLPVPKVEIDKRKDPAKRESVIKKLHQLAEISLQKTNAPSEIPGLAGKVLVANLSTTSISEVRWLVKCGYLPVKHPLVSASRTLTQRELGKAFGHVISRIGDLASQKNRN